MALCDTELRTRFTKNIYLSQFLVEFIEVIALGKVLNVNALLFSIDGQSPR